MRKLTLCCVFLLLMAAFSAGAIEVRLHDGTVITADSYTINGSFIMLTMADGRKVGYSVEDVDMDSLKQPEPAAPESTEKAGASSQSGGAFGGALKLADEGKSVLTLTDSDVDHVRPQREVEGEAEEAPKPKASAGAVVLEDIRVEGVDGQYHVQGRVANQTGGKVMNVRVALTAVGSSGETLGSGEEVAAASLEDGGEATFSHTFVVDSKQTPKVSAKLMWMQVGPPKPQAKDQKAAPAGEQ